MRGLNGEIVYQRKNVRVGRVNGESYGYKRPLWVTVDVCVERLDRQPIYETVNHAEVTNPLDFSITTAVWRPDNRDWTSGGATVEPLRELVTYADGFSAEQAAELAGLGYWHLNAMRAGCAHQEVVYEDSRYGRRPSLDRTPVCTMPEALVIHPGRNGGPAGYRYGHAWLVEELPAGFTERLMALMPPA